MRWVLEFHRTEDDTWIVFTTGALEDCLADALTLRKPDSLWSRFYDGARLGFTR